MICRSSHEVVLAVAGVDNRIRVYDNTHKDADGEWKVRLLNGHTKAINSLSFSYDGELLLSGADDLTARAWDIQAQSCIRVIQAESTVTATLWHPHDPKQVRCSNWDVVFNYLNAIP